MKNLYLSVLLLFSFACMNGCSAKKEANDTQEGGEAVSKLEKNADDEEVKQENLKTESATIEEKSKTESIVLDQGIKNHIIDNVDLICEIKNLSNQGIDKHKAKLEELATKYKLSIERLRKDVEINKSGEAFENIPNKMLNILVEQQQRCDLNEKKINELANKLKAKGINIQ